MKHIKKFINYLLGRFFETIGWFDKSALAYSKVVRYRYFFADAGIRFSRVFRLSGGRGYLLIQGGIGDILQSLPFMLLNKDFNYLVQTHFPGAESLLTDLGLKTHEIHVCTDLSDYKRLERDLIKRENVFMCPRQLFFDRSPFFFAPSQTDNPKNTVGIHVGASAIAIQKALPDSFLIDLLEQLNELNFEILLFCTKKEADHFRNVGIVETRKLKFVSEENISISLSQVGRCGLFIGSDSVFKTMSSMLRIPTFVLFHKIKNRFRDRMFINPYVKEGVISYFEYDHFSIHEVELIFSGLRLWIKDVVSQ